MSRIIESLSATWGDRPATLKGCAIQLRGFLLALKKHNPTCFANWYGKVSYKASKAQKVVYTSHFIKKLFRKLWQCENNIKKDFAGLATLHNGMEEGDKAMHLRVILGGANNFENVCQLVLPSTGPVFEYYKVQEHQEALIDLFKTYWCPDTLSASGKQQEGQSSSLLFHLTKPAVSTASSERSQPQQPIGKIGVYWNNRPANLGECTLQLHNFFIALGQHNPYCFPKWDEQKGMLIAKEAFINQEEISMIECGFPEEKPGNKEREDVKAFLLECEKHLNYKDDSVYPATSYCAVMSYATAIDNKEKLNLVINLGAATAHYNCCEIELPKAGSVFDYYQNPHHQEDLIRFLTTYWNPETLCIWGTGKQKKCLRNSYIP